MNLTELLLQSSSALSVILFANLVRKIRDENPLLEKTKDVRKGKRRFG